MDVNISDVSIAEVKDSVQRDFQAMAEERKLSYTVDVAPDVPAVIQTDGQRLEQILRNLLSNSFKFTTEGGVSVHIRRADKARRFADPVLDNSPAVIAFAVQDTGSASRRTSSA